MRFLDRVVGRAIDAAPIMRPRRASAFEPSAALPAAFPDPAFPASPAAPTLSAQSDRVAGEPQSDRAAPDAIAHVATDNAKVAQPVEPHRRSASTMAVAIAPTLPASADAAAPRAVSLDASSHEIWADGTAISIPAISIPPILRTDTHHAPESGVFSALRDGQSEPPLPADSNHGAASREVRPRSREAIVPTHRVAAARSFTNGTPPGNHPIDRDRDRDDNHNDNRRTRATPSEADRGALDPPALQVMGKLSAGNPNLSTPAERTGQARTQPGASSADIERATASGVMARQPSAAAFRETPAAHAPSAGVQSHAQETASIVISIGTIDVRQPAPAPRAAPAPPPPPRRTLDAYLARRAQAKNR